MFVGIVTQTWHFFIAFGVFLAVTQAFTFVPLQASIGGWFRRPSGPRHRTAAGRRRDRLRAAGSCGRLPCWMLVGWRETFWLIAFLSAAVLIILCSIYFRSKPADAGISGLTVCAATNRPTWCPPVETAQAAAQGVRPAHEPKTRAFWNLPTIHGLGCAGHGIVLIFVIDYAQGNRNLRNQWRVDSVLHLRCSVLWVALSSPCWRSVSAASL